MMKIHEKAHEKEETLGAEGQKFFKKAILTLILPGFLVVPQAGGGGINPDIY